MTDRQLLELAAKAARLRILEGRNTTGMHPAMNALAAPKWNPLTDDGDALRLALTLKLDIYHKGPTVYVGLPKDKLSQACPFTAGPGASADDIRHAIVRAAAAIGSAM